MDDAASSLAEALARTDDLPSLPTVAAEVLVICRQDDANLAELAQVLARDPVLSARLLRYANSSLYSLGHEVTTLQRAAVVLGLKTVQLVSLSFSLVSQLPRQGRCASFDYEDYWRRSMICAVASRSMAHLTDTATDDEAFLCGLLSEIGKLLLAEYMNDLYDEVLEQACGSWPSLVLERRLLGFDSAEIGATLLEQWELPPIIHLAARYSAKPGGLPRGVPPEITANTRVLHLARLTVELLASENKSEALAQLERYGQQYFELAPVMLYDYITSLEGGIREASEMLNVKLPPGRTTESILEEARREFTHVSEATAEQPPPRVPASDSRESAKDLTTLAPLDPVLAIPGREAFELHLCSELSRMAAGKASSTIGLLRLLCEESGSTDPPDDPRPWLAELTRVLGATVRRGDLLAYLGGREFGMVVQDGTPYGLRILAERVRRAAARPLTPRAETMPSTEVTIAGAPLGPAADYRAGPALMEAVAALLRRARARGGNRILIREEPLDAAHPGA